MLDDCIACVAPAGGIQLRPCEPQLVDHADEGTGSHRWPDAEDSHADHLTFGLGDDDRRGGNIEEVAQEVGVPVPVHRIVAVGRDESNGGVEIGRSGVADVNLHEDPQRGMRACDCSGVLLDDPPEGYHGAPDEPLTDGRRTDGRRAQYVLRRTIGRRYDAATLTRRDRACAVTRANGWRN